METKTFIRAIALCAQIMSFVMTKCISSDENDVLSKRGLQDVFFTYNGNTVCEISQIKTEKSK